MSTPADLEAEATVVGCCVSLDWAYRLAAERLDAEDFWVPQNRRLFEACGALAHLAGTDLDTEARRIAEAAAAARMEPSKVRGLVEGRASTSDRDGRYAGRVAAAARARKLMCACAEIYRRLEAGEGAERALEGEPTDLVDRLRGVA